MITLAMTMSLWGIFLYDDDVVILKFSIVAIAVVKFDWLNFVLLSVIKQYPLAVFSIYSKAVTSKSMPIPFFFN